MNHPMHAFQRFNVKCLCVSAMPSNRTLAINKLRASREEIDIPFHLTQTLPDEEGSSCKFLLEDSGEDNRVLVFGTEKNLEWMSRYLEW